MKNHAINRLFIATGLALAGSASAVTLDLSGTNFYMKFLDGNQRGGPSGSIDTASGGDQGQFTELNLIFKATISPQVEAGGRIQSRSSAAYWSEYGGFGKENAGGGYVNNEINHQKFMKLRGAYVEMTPGYSWLNLARIGTSDWGMFDPFTVGKVRYIDRDNYNGFYFKGPMPMDSSWELARVSLPEYLQFNWGQGPVCCSTDSTQYNEAVYIAQFKVPVNRARLAASYQSFIDHTLAPTANPFTGVNTKGIYRNAVTAFKAEGSAVDGLDLRVAYYRSESSPSDGSVGEVWGNSPTGAVSDKAIKLGVDWTLTPIEGLGFNFQYFNIGAGYYSNTAARRESDVLLTEGFESAWYNWGNPLWSGGAAADFTQSASNRPLTDNAFMDFDESPAESAVGWKGGTVVGRYEIVSSPMSLEYTRLSYDNNWQNYSGPLSNLYAANQDRTTNIAAFKINHVFSVFGGLDTNFKYKRVADRDDVSLATAADDRKVFDNGIVLSAGNQLFNHLYGTLSYGRYIRHVAATSIDLKNTKSIYGVRFAYNLPGFELGMLTQWIRGRGNPTEAPGGEVDIQQYRMKAFAQVNF